MRHPRRSDSLATNCLAMQPIVRAGFLFYGLALLGIGVVHFVFGHSPVGLIPMGEGWVYAIDGAVLAVTGGCIAAGAFATSAGTRMNGAMRWVRLAAFAAAAFIGLLYVCVGLPKEIMHPKDPGGWTGPAELLCLGAGALLVARAAGAAPRWVAVSRYVLGACLVVFGVQHFLYDDYCASVIPTWIPKPYFWTYFVAIAYFATTISLVLNVLVRLSALLAAIMFFTWVLILHGPLVATHVHVEPQWTSGFVCLGMGALFLALYALSPRVKPWLIKQAPRQLA